MPESIKIHFVRIYNHAEGSLPSPMQNCADSLVYTDSKRCCMPIHTMKSLEEMENKLRAPDFMNRICMQIDLQLGKGRYGIKTRMQRTRKCSKKTPILSLRMGVIYFPACRRSLPVRLLNHVPMGEETYRLRSRTSEILRWVALRGFFEKHGK